MQNNFTSLHICLLRQLILIDVETTWRQYRDNLGKTLGQLGDDLNKIQNIREKNLGTTLVEIWDNFETTLG